MRCILWWAVIIRFRQAHGWIVMTTWASKAIAALHELLKGISLILVSAWYVNLHQIHQVQDRLISVLVELCLHGQTNRLCLLLTQSDVQCLLETKIQRGNKNLGLTTNTS